MDRVMPLLIWEKHTEYKTFLMKLQISINTGEDLKQYNDPLSPARVSYLDVF